MEAYKHSQHEMEILCLLTLGEKEIEAGKGYDLEAVLAEADFLMKKSLAQRSTSGRTRRSIKLLKIFRIGKRGQATFQCE